MNLKQVIGKSLLPSGALDISSLNVGALSGDFLTLHAGIVVRHLLLNLLVPSRIVVVIITVSIHTWLNRLELRLRVVLTDQRGLIEVSVV